MNFLITLYFFFSPVNDVQSEIYRPAKTGDEIHARNEDVLLGDINLDGVVNLLDVGPFIELLGDGVFQLQADMNGDGTVNLLDVDGFIDVLSG